MFFTIKTRYVFRAALAGLALMLGTAGRAGETLGFSELVAPDGSGWEKLRATQSGEIDTHHIVNDANDEIELVTTLLNNAVIAHVRRLPEAEGLVMLKSHQKFWKYFDSLPSSPNCSGTEHAIEALSMDRARLKARWRAVCLPYPEYLVYAKIANCCCVRLDCGTYKMRFGEVGVKKLADWFLDDQVVAVYGKYYYDFPTVIWPESCRAVTLGDDTFYLAVLDNRRADGAWKKGVFLCTWNKHGEPLAVRELDDCQTLKTLAADADGRVSISYGTSGGKTAVRTFRLAESNAVTIRSAEMR